MGYNEQIQDLRARIDYQSERIEELKEKVEELEEKINILTALRFPILPEYWERLNK